MDKKSSPTVSVVMPTYNRAHLLPDVIASIMDQDYKDLELLVVDDCSTDQTEQVIYKLQLQDRRLRYHRLSENMGVGFARQTGLDNVSGNYIALADSDDLWKPGKLKAQVEVLEVHPEIDILFGDYLDINHITNQEIGGFKHTSTGMQFLNVKQIQEHLYLIERGVDTGILVADFIAVPTMVIRSTLFNQTGGFNINLIGAADLEFGFRAAILGAKFAYLDYPLINRHIYPDSETMNKIQSHENVMKSLLLCRDLCGSTQRDDLVVHVDRALQRNYFTLMYNFGESGNRRQVWNSYRKVFSYGFSVLDFAYFLIFWGGPSVLSFARRLRGSRKP
jgi:glycosyltransferase involved in cell wall biosynthesis